MFFAVLVGALLPVTASVCSIEFAQRVAFECFLASWVIFVVLVPLSLVVGSGIWVHLGTLLHIARRVGSSDLTLSNNSGLKLWASKMAMGSDDACMFMAYLEGYVDDRVRDVVELHPCVSTLRVIGIVLGW